MALTLTGTGGVFTRLGKVVKTLNDINTARGTTVPTDIAAILTALQAGSPTLQVKALGDTLAAAGDSFDSGGQSTTSSLRQYAQNLIVQMVLEDNPQPSNDLTSSLIELIAQIKTAVGSVDAATVSVSTSVGGSNVGNGIVLTSTKRGDGLVNENMFPEDIVLTVTNDATVGSESISAKGEQAEPDKLSWNWPQGSGSSRSLQAVNASNTGANLLTNGSFENDTDVTDAPDDWEKPLATPGTTLKITDVEVETITIAGTPTTGTYTISYTDASSRVQTTVPLAFNASGSAVQAALRSLVGLGSVTVTTTGTTPNFAHTVTFTGVNGNVTQLTSTSLLDTGTITHATTNNGTTNSYAGGRSLEFASNGTQLTSIQQQVALKPLTQYGFNCWLKMSVVPAAGVVKFSLWDGNAVINDAQSVANSFSITLSGTSTSFVSKTGVFRTPRNLPPIVYLRIELTTAIDSGKSMYIDHAALTPLTELYAGGPMAAVFSGSVGFKKGDSQNPADNWTLAVANDRAGAFQEAFERFFDMRDKGLILPSDNSNAETILDSLTS